VFFNFFLWSGTLCSNFDNSLNPWASIARNLSWRTFVHETRRPRRPRSGKGCLERGPRAPTSYRGSGERCKLPQRGSASKMHFDSSILDALYRKVGASVFRLDLAEPLDATGETPVENTGVVWAYLFNLIASLAPKDTSMHVGDTDSPKWSQNIFILCWLHLDWVRGSLYVRK